MIKCEVIVDRVSLVVGKGSIVYVDERQFELAKQFVIPVDKKNDKVKAVETKEKVVVDTQEKEEKKSTKK